MEQDKLERLARRLRSRLPFIGAGIRRGACRELAADGAAETVPHLADALASGDAELRAIADAGLRALSRQPAVDALCALWAESRDAALTAIVTDCSYVATQPARARVLSGLLSDALHGEDAEAGDVPVLVEALDDADAAIRARAAVALRCLALQPAVDALCEAAIADPAGPAAAVAVEKDYRHSLVSRRCLLLLLTGQIERYLDLDFDLRHARAEYEAGDEALRGRLADLVRQSGDTRLAGILLAPSMGPISKRAADLTEEEANVVVEVYARHGRWAEVLGLMSRLPLSAVLAALDLLAGSGWSPEDREDAEFLRELLALRKDVGTLPEPPPPPGLMLGPVFGKWIDEGRSGETSQLSPERLRQDLRQASPRPAVAALSALQHRGLLSPDDIEAARTSPHWLVRLGYLALCPVAPELAFSWRPISGEGGGLWVDQWAPHLLGSALRGSRALSLTLDQIEAIRDAADEIAAQDPVRAALGRILCALGIHRLRHAIEIDDGLIVAIDETDIEVDE